MKWLFDLFKSSDGYDKKGKPSSTLVGHTEPKKPVLKIHTNTILEKRELPPVSMKSFSKAPEHPCCNHDWNHWASPAQCKKCDTMYQYPKHR